MTAAEMTLKAKRGVAFKGNCIDVCTTHVLARVQTKRQGRYYESLKIEAFFFCAREANRDTRVSFLFFPGTDVGRFVNANRALASPQNHR